MTLSTIGKRLGEWGMGRFGVNHGWKTRLATALEMKLPAIRNYLNDERRPGVEVQNKLRVLGCDIEWLMTGTSRDTDGTPPTLKAPLIRGSIRITSGGDQKFEPMRSLVHVPLFASGEFALLFEGDTSLAATDGGRPTEILPGDILLFDPSSRPNPGDITAIQIRRTNKWLVKVLMRRQGDELVLGSSSKFTSYPDLVIKKDSIASSGVFVGKIRLPRQLMKRLRLTD